MIEIDHLTKRFGDFCAVDDVSFQVNEGKTFALLGPNGSGKTTALKCLVGLMSPTAGRIRVNGVDLWTHGREARKLISFLPQRVAFHETLTAREVLEFYCRLRKLPLDRVDHMLEQSSFNFNGFADRAVSEFSGGMVQRLGIAVALLPDAPILILDEPTVSLDPEGALRFREVLSTLKREGRTIIFSSHVLSDVEALADRVAILVGGKMVALESVEMLRTEMLINSRIRVRILNPDESFQRAALRAGAKEATLSDDVLTLSSYPEDRLPILRAIEAAGAVIEKFMTEEPALEEIYLRYVNETNSSHRAAHDERVSESAASTR